MSESQLKHMRGNQGQIFHVTSRINIDMCTITMQVYLNTTHVHVPQLHYVLVIAQVERFLTTQCFVRMPCN